MSAPRAGVAWLDAVVFNAEGLVPVIAQEHATGRVLMMAWADRDALLATQASGQGTYFSRSRARQWRKGEQSGHAQRVLEMRLDCDGDTVLYVVEQAGGVACHTGRASCFYRRLEADDWTVVDPVLVDPRAATGRESA